MLSSELVLACSYTIFPDKRLERTLRNKIDIILYNVKFLLFTQIQIGEIESNCEQNESVSFEAVLNSDYLSLKLDNLS